MSPQQPQVEQFVKGEEYVYKPSEDSYEGTFSYLCSSISQDGKQCTLTNNNGVLDRRGPIRIDLNNKSQAQYVTLVNQLTTAQQWLLDNKMLSARYIPDTDYYIIHYDNKTKILKLTCTAGGQVKDDHSQILFRIEGCTRTSVKDDCTWQTLKNVPLTLIERIYTEAKNTDGTKRFQLVPSFYKDKPLETEPTKTAQSGFTFSSFFTGKSNPNTSIPGLVPTDYLSKFVDPTGKSLNVQDITTLYNRNEERLRPDREAAEQLAQQQEQEKQAQAAQLAQQEKQAHEQQERDNRQQLLKNFATAQQSAATAADNDYDDAAGGKRYRKSRKSRKTRKSRKARKSRKTRKARKTRKSRKMH
jgi:hypothetical protein